jgi:hypothetical protein
VWSGVSSSGLVCFDIEIWHRKTIKIMCRFAHKSFLKEKRKKESSLVVGEGWLSSFFEKIQPGF